MLDHKPILKSKVKSSATITSQDLANQPSGSSSTPITHVTSKRPSQTSVSTTPHARPYDNLSTTPHARSNANYPSTPHSLPVTSMSQRRSSSTGSISSALMTAFSLDSGMDISGDSGRSSLTPLSYSSGMTDFLF